MQNSLKINCGSLISNDGTIQNSSLTIKEGKIAAIDASYSEADLDLSEYIVVPGFIDIHTHGFFGIDSCNSSDSEILDWVQRITETGVTSFVPSLVSLPLNEIYGQFERYRKIMAGKREGASILGVRCEGPYLSREKRGAHNIDNLRIPEIHEISDFFNKGTGVLRIIDIAPELAEIGPVIELARKKGIIVSTGHSNTDFATALKAFEAGSPLVTHFYDAMSSLTHREVGLVGAGLLHNKVALELIADLHHVSEEAIRIMDRMRSFRNTVLVTDSLAVGGSTGGNFTLGGLPITLHDGVAWIGDTDTIAGSVLTMDKAIHNLTSIGYKLQDLIYSTSGIQARLLGLDDRGDISPGLRADLCALDEDGKVIATIVNGKLVYQNF